LGWFNASWDWERMPGPFLFLGSFFNIFTWKNFLIKKQQASCLLKRQTLGSRGARWRLRSRTSQFKRTYGRPFPVQKYHVSQRGPRRKTG
jgi:hypothetical protein